MPARDGTRGSPRSKVEDNRDAGRDTLFHREVPRNSPLTPTLSGSTELAEVHPKRTGEGKERDGTREVSKVQGRRSEARDPDDFGLWTRGLWTNARDGTRCFIEKNQRIALTRLDRLRPRGSGPATTRKSSCAIPGWKACRNKATPPNGGRAATLPFPFGIVDKKGHSSFRELAAGVRPKHMPHSATACASGAPP